MVKVWFTGENILYDIVDRLRSYAATNHYEKGDIWTTNHLYVRAKLNCPFCGIRHRDDGTLLVGYIEKVFDWHKDRVPVSTIAGELINTITQYYEESRFM